jgi:hypothetical protein
MGGATLAELDWYDAPHHLYRHDEWVRICLRQRQSYIIFLKEHTKIKFFYNGTVLF